MVRLLYLLAVIDLLVCAVANVGSLLGFDWFVAIFFIWGAVLFLMFALAVAGFSSENLGFGFLLVSAGRAPFGFGGYNHSWVMRRLPGFTQNIVYAAWAVAVIGFLSMLVFMLTHTHGSYHHTSTGRVLATKPPQELRLENAWVLYGFSSAAIYWLIYPALYFFFALPDPDAD